MPGPTWVFDTSALIAVKSVPKDTRPALWAAMTELVRHGRLRMPREVIDELKRGSDDVSAWAQAVEAPATKDSPSLAQVQSVLAVVPDVLDPAKDSGADEADPYVLAMAINLNAQGADVRIVTQESKDKPGKTSLNTAAGILGLISVPLLGFMRVEGIS